MRGSCVRPLSPKRKGKSVLSNRARYLKALGEKPVTLDRLQNELNAAVKKDPQVTLAIRADRKSPIGEVIKIWDAAKTANISPDRVKLITEKPPGK